METLCKDCLWNTKTWYAEGLKDGVKAERERILKIIGNSLIVNPLNSKFSEDRTENVINEITEGVKG